MAIDGSKLNSQEWFFSWTRTFRYGPFLCFVKLNQIKPGIEMVKIQKFLGISTTINQDSFVYNSERQFFCLKSAGMGCMGKGKGRSAGHNFEHYLHDKLRNLFRPFDQNLAKLLNTTLDWNYWNPMYSTRMNRLLWLVFWLFWKWWAMINVTFKTW